MTGRPPRSPLFPSTTLFRSKLHKKDGAPAVASRQPPARRRSGSQTQVNERRTQPEGLAAPRRWQMLHQKGRRAGEQHRRADSLDDSKRDERRHTGRGGAKRAPTEEYPETG